MDPSSEMHILPRIIAIDGPAASGKSTLAERLAARLGYFNFDTGVMYRAVTYAALQNGLPVEDEAKVTALAESLQIDVLPATHTDGRPCTVLVDGIDVTWAIRQPEVDRNVSPVSTYAGVRQAMTAQQRRIAERGQIIMAGRDIGTVVVPHAECKIFLTASLEARAIRRMLDRQRQGRAVALEQMRDEILKRDQIDSRRAIAPLRAADDAIWLDNSDLSLDQTVDCALEIIYRRAHELAARVQ